MSLFICLYPLVSAITFSGASANGKKTTNIPLQTIVPVFNYRMESKFHILLLSHILLGQQPSFWDHFTTARTRRRLINAQIAVKKFASFRQLKGLYNKDPIRLKLIKQ